MSYTINGTEVLNSTTLGSGINNASLTSNTGDLTNTGNLTITGDLEIGNSNTNNTIPLRVAEHSTLTLHDDSTTINQVYGIIGRDNASGMDANLLINSCRSSHNAGNPGLVFTNYDSNYTGTSKIGILGSVRGDGIGGDPDGGGTLSLYSSADGLTQSLGLSIDENQDVNIPNDLVVNSSTLVVDTTNNYVGIGTSEPVRELHIEVGGGNGYDWSGTGSSFVDCIIESNVDSILALSAGANQQSEIWFGDNSVANAGRVRYEHSLDRMEFWVNGGEKMSLSSTGDLTLDSGDLAIGTTTMSTDVATNTVNINNLIVDNLTISSDFTLTDLNIAGDTTLSKLAVDTDTLVVDSTNNAVIIGATEVLNDIPLQIVGHNALTLHDDTTTISNIRMFVGDRDDISGQDSGIVINSSRGTNSNALPELFFTNYDQNYATGTSKIGLLGSVKGIGKTNDVDGGGGIRLYSSSDGLTENYGLEVDENQDVNIPNDLVVSGLTCLTNPFCTFTRSAAQTTTSGENTVVDFDVETYNRGGFVNTSGTVTIPTDGVYQVIGQLGFEQNTNNVRKIWLVHVENGNTTEFGHNFKVALSAHETTLNCSGIISMEAGSTLRLFCYQNRGGTLDISGSTTSNTYMQISYIGKYL